MLQRPTDSRTTMQKEELPNKATLSIGVVQEITEIWNEMEIRKFTERHKVQNLAVCRNFSLKDIVSTLSKMAR